MSNPVEGKQMEVLKTFLLVAIIFVILRLLFKFNLLKFGDSKEEKDVKKLTSIPAFNTGFEKTLVDAIAKKEKVSKPTKAQLAKYIPSTTELKRWTNNLWDAKSFYDDDEAKTYSVFREMNSQLDVWAFAKFFSGMKNKDLFGFLASYLDAEELSFIYGIIKSKPLI